LALFCDAAWPPQAAGRCGFGRAMGFSVVHAGLRVQAGERGKHCHRAETILPALTVAIAIFAPSKRKRIKPKRVAGLAAVGRGQRLSRRLASISC